MFSFSNKTIIKEICLKLECKIEFTNDVLYYAELFFSTYAHMFAPEVILSACIYLAGKLHEDFKRFRDIINVAYFVKSKHEKIRLDEGEDYVKYLIEDRYDVESNIILVKTMKEITIDNYYLIREEIIKAEQHLLRIINYAFESRAKEIFLTFLNYADYFEFDKKNIQLGWNVINMAFETMSAVEINEDALNFIFGVVVLVLELKVHFNKDNHQCIGEFIRQNKKLNQEKIYKLAAKLLEEYLKL